MAEEPDQSSKAVPTISTVARRWGFTNVKVVDINYMWTINNFSLCYQKIGDSIVSPKFSGGTNDGITWYLGMYPMGDKEADKSSISLFLYLESCDKPEIKAEFTFSLLNDKMKKCHSQMSNITTFRPACNGHGFSSYIERHILYNSLLTNDRLTLLCEIRAIEGIVGISGQNNIVQFNFPKDCLPDDLRLLYETHKYSDVTLSVDGNEYKAHKAILAARSSVFTAMFERDKRDLRQNVIKINGIKEEVFKKMLTYIYTDTVMNLDEMAADLLVAADMYNLKKLKVICEEALFKNLDIDNAADILNVANLHGAEQLKSQAMEFINTHAKAVVETAGFENMVRSSPSLVAETFRAWVTRKDRNSDEAMQFAMQQGNFQP